MTTRRKPTVPAQTRTGGQGGARSRRGTIKPVRITTRPISKGSLLDPNRKRPRGGQGAAREQPRINQTFVPRQGAPDVFIPDEPQIESASFGGQAGDFVKNNKLVVFGVLGVVALLALRK